MEKNWLQVLLDDLGYKQADLVKRSNIDSAVISNILNDHRKVGLDICLKIADATGRSPMEILTRAKLIPADPDTNTTLEQIKHTTAGLPPEEQINVLEYALLRKRLTEERGIYNGVPATRKGATTTGD